MEGLKKAIRDAGGGVKGIAQGVADFLGKTEAGGGIKGGGARQEEAVGYPNYRADQVSKVKADATDVNQGLNESVDAKARFKKLANIKG